MGWKIDFEDVITGLTEFGTKFNAAVEIYAQTSAKKFESYAKEHRPWTDRTGRARQGLTGYVTTTGTGWRINIAHTVDYGLWLEHARNKKYAILEPTVRLNSDEVLAGLKVLML